MRIIILIILKKISLMSAKILSSKKILDNSESYYFNVEKNSINNLKTAKDSRSPSLEETEFTNHLITRKTYRGRKEKIPFPKNKLKCEICLKFSDFSTEDLISCSTCKCLFHKSCYDQLELSENSLYKCIRCAYAVKLNKMINEFNCFICGNSNGVLNINSATKCFYHKICLDLLIEFKGLEGEDICKEKIRKWRYKNSCRYCGEKLSKNKAVIKCKNPKCKEFYHIPCAIEKGMIFDLNYMKKYYDVENNDEIPFYCSNHNKKISFKFKMQIANNNNELISKKNLEQNDLNLNENEEKKSFHHFLEDINKKEIFENNLTISNIEKEDLKNKNSKIISIIEEENINSKNKEDCQVEKNLNFLEEKKNNNICMNMDIDFDDCIGFNNSNAFKLDFEKIDIQNESNNKKNDECIIDEKFLPNNQYHNFSGLNSNLPFFNENSNYLISRKQSFNSLSFNI